jgi:putative PEP-CTERM system TPR-repeat lipoprotein
MLGRHYLASGRLESALEEVEAAKALTPDDARVLDTLAEVQVRLGRNADALNLLASLSVLRPDSPPVLYRLAKAQIAQGQTSAAAITLRRALELRPTFTSARFALGQLDLASGRVDASLRAAWRLQDEAPDSPQGLVLEGDVHRYEGRWQHARAAYERAWNVQPSAELLLRLQEALTALGRDGEARERMQAWLREHPADVPVRKRLADSLLVSGSLAEAKEAYLAALELTPDDVAILNNLAWIGFKRDEPTALSYAERAYKLKPSEPDVLDTLAQIVARRGDWMRARQLMVSALSLAPDRPDIRFRLAQLLAEAGNQGEALKELRTVVERGESFAGHAEAAALLRRLER